MILNLKLFVYHYIRKQWVLHTPSVYIFPKWLCIFSGRNDSKYPAVFSKMFHNFAVSLLTRCSMCSCKLPKWFQIADRTLQCCENIVKHCSPFISEKERHFLSSVNRPKDCNNFSYCTVIESKTQENHVGIVFQTPLWVRNGEEMIYWYYSFNILQSQVIASF